MKTATARGLTLDAADKAGCVKHIADAYRFAFATTSRASERTDIDVEIAVNTSTQLSHRSLRCQHR